jgi:phage/plasmid-like protein (TIGR03299 family)
MDNQTTTTGIIDPKVQMLNKTGLNWKVNKESLQTVSGILIPERIALVREDTKKVLGVHTDSYEPYQNEELLDLLYQISKQSGLVVHTGGCFKGGEKVWFQLKSDTLQLPNNDRLEGYVSGFNSFDGRTSLAFGNTSVTVSCMNTFWRGYKQVETRLRHSSQMRPRIEEILRRIDVVLNEEKEMFNEVLRLGDKKLDPQVRELITKKLFEIGVEERLDSPTLSTNKKNKLVRFNYDLGLEMGQKGDNLWGLWSGVTRYTTHSMKRGDNSESKMFGRTGTLEREIYKELVEMV